VAWLAEGASAVIFDFFGTLTPGTPAGVWREQAAQVAAALGVDEQALFGAFHDSFGERVTGALGDLPQTMRALAGRLGLQPTPARLAAACRVRRQAQRELFTLRPDAIGVIEWLRGRGRKIGVLSDCTIELPEHWPELPISAVVDTAVFSCTAGFRKPDQRLFSLVTQGLAVDPGDCVYVGDGGGHELSGAREAGMRAVLLADDDWHASAAGEREEGWDGPRISSLSALCRQDGKPS
jgi:putative hydrolase of the HAD superfamily